MENHYETLGIHDAASQEEIRRAYRVLARRYHPDVNPGKSSEEKFKRISEAYHILSDQEKRRVYDLELQGFIRSNVSEGMKAYARAQRAHGSARKRFYEAKHQNFGKLTPEGAVAEDEDRVQHPRTPRRPRQETGLFDRARSLFESFRKPPVDAKPPPQSSATNQRPHEARPSREQRPAAPSVMRISVVEVSLSVRDAIFGVRKSIEISEPEGSRKVSVNIPAGVRNGSVVHLRSKGHTGEDLVIVVRVASHPFLSVQPRGVVAEIPISVQEAISGASISIPTLDDPIVIKIPPACQSGSEIRLKGKGAPQRDGTRGDLFIRLLVRVPESPDAVGIKEKAAQFEAYYEKPVRQHLAQTLLE